MAEVLLELEDGVAVVTLDAPHRRNAFVPTMVHELLEICDRIDADETIGAVVVRANGPSFCAGAHRAVLAEAGRDPARPDRYRELELTYRAFARVGELRPPTVAAVRGHAVGAGVNLMLATDLRVVAEDARIIAGFLRIGIHPGGGHFALLARLAGREAAAAMSSPMSSHLLAIRLEERLEGAMLGRVVGRAVLPAVPDDEEPGAGEDADRVRVVVAAGDGAAVEVGSPGVGADGVAGEVADGVAELLVGGPAEADGTVLARLASARRDAGQAGQGLRGREASAAVADLGQQAGGADGAGAGKAGEDVGVGVQGELLFDLLGKDLDLLHQGAQGGQKGAGDVGLGGSLGARGAPGRGGEPRVQGGGSDAAAVADADQPGGEAPGGEPVSAVLAVEAGEEAQADRAVDLREEADGAREGALEVGAQLVGERDSVSDQVLARPAGGPQGDGGRAVGDERAQPDPVGAEGVGEDEGVEAVVLVAGRAVAGAQVLELVGADDDDGHAGLEVRLSDRAVGPFDGDLVGARLGQPPDEVAEPGGRKGVLRRMLHISLLAAGPSGEAPDSWCRDAAASSLTVRRSEALSPIDGRRVPGNHPGLAELIVDFTASSEQGDGPVAPRGIGDFVLVADIHRVHR